jgi:hypothetical protein
MMTSSHQAISRRGRTDTEGEDMFKRIVEFITLKWLWDRRKTGKPQSSRRGKR